MTPAFKLYDRITARSDDERCEGLIEGLYVRTTADVANDYHKDQLPTIPAGTWLKCDFAGDFGLYAMADVGGTLHKVKLHLPDTLGSIDWSEHFPDD